MKRMVLMFGMLAGLVAGCSASDVPVSGDVPVSSASSALEEAPPPGSSDEEMRRWVEHVCFASCDRSLLDCYGDCNDNGPDPGNPNSGCNRECGHDLSLCQEMCQVIFGGNGGI